MKLCVGFKWTKTPESRTNCLKTLHILAKSFLEIFPVLNICLRWTYSWVNNVYMFRFYNVRVRMYKHVYSIIWISIHIQKLPGWWAFFFFFFSFPCSWLNHISLFWGTIANKTFGIWELGLLLLTLRRTCLYCKVGYLTALFQDQFCKLYEKIFFIV